MCFLSEVHSKVCEFYEVLWVYCDECGMFWMVDLVQFFYCVCLILLFFYFFNRILVSLIIMRGCICLHVKNSFLGVKFKGLSTNMHWRNELILFVFLLEGLYNVALNNLGINFVHFLVIMMFGFNNFFLKLVPLSFSGWWPIASWCFWLFNVGDYLIIEF